MTICRFAALALCLGMLSGCGIFGGEDEVAEVTGEPIDPLTIDPRPLAANILSVEVERTQNGTIIRAVGVASAQGFWETELLPVNFERPQNGQLVYQFRLLPPGRETNVGTQRSRELVAVRVVPNQTLAGVRAITVVGTESQRSARP